jgi:hypothetical protein
VKRFVPVVLLLLASLAAACATDGAPWSGEVLPAEPLVLQSPNEGVHPDRSVLDDPANPFADGELTDATIWQLQANGGAVAAFYAWATQNARGATGERQYYTSLDLKTVFDRGLAAEQDLPLVKDVAIRGFQAVLAYFPDAVTYDASGTIAYELATPSVMAILELGGTADGWVLVMTPDGRTVAVPR